MTTTTRDNARWISEAPCYIADNDDHNPYRLTLYIADNGAIMLAADGNGCGNDIALEDIDGWSDADINEQYRHINTTALARNVEGLRAAGFADEADYVWDWLCHADSARCEGDPCHADNLVVELAYLGDEATAEDLDHFVDALHADGYTWARAANDGEEGDTSGITDAEWSRIMAEALNR